MALTLPKQPIAGFVDLFGARARMGAAVASRLMHFFESWGYSRLQLPIVERADAFSEEVMGHSPWPEWDTRCSLLVDVPDYRDAYRQKNGSTTGLLIPEGTVSVARWLAGWISDRDAPFPLKVAYHCQCFRNEPVDKLTATKLRQFEQVGTEILGSSELVADLETLNLIAAGLTILGVDRSAIRHRVSDIRLFNHLAAEVVMDEATRVALKEALDAIAEARAGRDQARHDRERRAFVSTLASVGVEGRRLDPWLALADTSAADMRETAATSLLPRELLDEVAERVKVLRRLGYNAVADLAVVRSHEYYTAMVMEVDVVEAHAIKVEVAGGGRYDRMIGAFVDGGNTKVPAVGFAYGVQRLIDFVRDPQRLQHTVTAAAGETDIVVEPSGDYCRDHRIAESLRDRGLRVDVLAGKPRHGTDAYAQRQQARVFHEDGQPVDALFNESYPELFFDPRTGEVAEAEVERALRWLGVDGRRSRILDVPCGIGRHSVALARRGHDVVGIDRSDAYLDRARTAARSAGVTGSAEFRRGDLRWLELTAGEFDHAVCLFNSLGYNEDADDLAALRAIARSLRPGGHLLLEVLNRDWVLAHYQDRRWLRGPSTTLLERNSFDVLTSRSATSYVALQQTEPGCLRAGEEMRLSFRIYSAHEIDRMLRAAGYDDVRIAGTLDGDTFDVRESRSICARATVR